MHHTHSSPHDSIARTSEVPLQHVVAGSHAFTRITRLSAGEQWLSLNADLPRVPERTWSVSHSRSVTQLTIFHECVTLGLLRVATWSNLIVVFCYCLLQITVSFLKTVTNMNYKVLKLKKKKKFTIGGNIVNFIFSCQQTHETRIYRKVNPCFHMILK